MKKWEHCIILDIYVYQRTKVTNKHDSFCSGSTPFNKTNYLTENNCLQTFFPIVKLITLLYSCIDGCLFINHIYTS